LLTSLLLLVGSPGLADQPPATPYEWRNVVIGGGGFSPNIIFSPAEKNLA
jgi:xyloglucan-specific exo-beta-1,4-glucanase